MILAQIKDEILIKKKGSLYKKIRDKTAISLDDFYVGTGIHLVRIETGKVNTLLDSATKIYNFLELAKVFVFGSGCRPK